MLNTGDVGYAHQAYPNPVIPADQYVAWVIEGAREHGLPEDYIAGLQALPPS